MPRIAVWPCRKISEETAMSVISNKKFANEVLQLAGLEDSHLPKAVYDPDGDCIEFVAKPDSFRAERVDDLVTVYYSHETGDIIGSLIKGVSRLCRALLQESVGMKIQILSGKVSLEHIFGTRREMYSKDATNKRIVLTYEKLIKVAREAQVETDICLQG